MNVPDDELNRPSKAGQSGPGLEPTVPVAWARIQLPGGDHNEYGWDAGRSRFYLRNVLQYSKQLPVDRGYVLDASYEGQPLELWLVRSYPMQEGSLVEARIIGVREPLGEDAPSCPPVLL